ncbi:MAG: hypothetical protein ABWX96_11750 [Propionibacteriaceae bacterium]
MNSRPGEVDGVAVRKAALHHHGRAEEWEGSPLSFWDVIVLLFCGYLLVIYVMFLVQIVGDLFFGARALSGWSKAAWLIGLVILPLVTAFIYLIARSRGMGTSEQPRVSWPPAAGGRNPSEQIADARAMLAVGTITQPEFDQIKARALA